jgi:predicted RNA-binding Zn-ribbon protein involved in translation (DUF1610 family)
MNAAAVLAELRRRGFTVAAHNGRLRVGPAVRLTREIDSLISEHRGEILELLAAEARGPRKCETCGDVITDQNYSEWTRYHCRKLRCAPGASPGEAGKLLVDALGGIWRWPKAPTSSTLTRCHDCPNLTDAYRCEDCAERALQAKYGRNWREAIGEEPAAASLEAAG